VRMALKRTAMKCFPDTPKGRGKALRLYVGAKKRRLRARLVMWKGLACVAARQKAK
jgi:hypothetical protein